MVVDPLEDLREAVEGLRVKEGDAGVVDGVEKRCEARSNVGRARCEGCDACCRDEDSDRECTRVCGGSSDVGSSRGRNGVCSGACARCDNDDESLCAACSEGQAR